MKKKIKNKIKKTLKFIYDKFGLTKYRRHLSVEKKDLDTFFKSLKDEEIDYVVLRWFDNLKNNTDGDIDILVSNAHYSKLKKHLKLKKLSEASFKVDLYTPINIKGNISYYIPTLAKKILSSRIYNEENVSRPSKKEHFLSFAYHLVVHKGYNSKIPSINNRSFASKDSKYKKELERISCLCNINLPKELTLEDLEEILKSYEWLPPLDLYFRRSLKNDYLGDRAKKLIKDDWKKKSDNAVLIFRKKSTDKSTIDFLKQKLETYKVEIIEEHNLNRKEAIKFSKSTRGGDWGIDETTESSELPTLVYHLRKRNQVSYEEDIPKGAVEYEWLLGLKREIRDFHHKTNSKKYTHILHTSDNGVEAALYLEEIEKIKS